MDARTRIDFDELMRILMVVGFVALATWVLSATVGIMSGYAHVSPPATLRFLLAVLILVFSRRTYWEICEWRWKKLDADERAGFTNPLSERSRANEHRIVDVTDEEPAPATTGSSHTRA